MSALAAGSDVRWAGFSRRLATAALAGVFQRRQQPADGQIRGHDGRYRRKYLKPVSGLPFPEDHVGFLGRKPGLRAGVFRNQNYIVAWNVKSVPDQIFHARKIAKRVLCWPQSSEHHASLVRTLTGGTSRLPELRRFGTSWSISYQGRIVCQKK